tara:strand:+ start:426 stop:641 length:216 start_codon:yes stop_codon:yes gene_type:complete
MAQATLESVSQLEALLSLESATALANIDYIVSLLNMKVTENLDRPDRVEFLTEILQEIKLVMAPVSSQELH